MNKELNLKKNKYTKEVQKYPPERLRPSVKPRRAIKYQKAILETIELRDYLEGFAVETHLPP